MTVAVCAALVLTPISVGAATGASMNIIDPYYPSSKARVTAAGTLWTTITDPGSKMQARVDAAGLKTSDGDTTVLLAHIPPSQAMFDMATLDLSKYSKIRVAAYGSGMVQLLAREGAGPAEDVPIMRFTVSNTPGGGSLDVPARKVIVWRDSGNIRIMVWGIQ